MIKRIWNNKFTTNSLILLLGSMVGGILNYFFHVLVGRNVSPVVYGQAESLISLINIISVPAMTFSMVATKYSAAYKNQNDPYKTRQLFTYLNRQIFFYGLPVILFIFLFTPAIGNFLNVPHNSALVLIWLIMLVSFFSSVSTGIISGWQRFKELSLSGVYGAVAKIGGGVLLITLGMALNGIIASFLLGTLATYLFSLYVLRFSLKSRVFLKSEDSLSVFHWKELKRYTWLVLLGNLAITILGNADMVLAKRNLDDWGAGEYGALNVISKAIFFAVGIMANVLFAMVAEKSHKKEKAFSIFKMAFGLTFLLSFSATVIYFLFPQMIIGIFFGAKYQTVSAYLGWFALSASLLSLVNIVFQFLLSLHQTKIVYWFFGAAISLIGLILVFGHSLYAILGIVIAVQSFILLIGLFFVKNNYDKIQLYNTD